MHTLPKFYNCPKKIKARHQTIIAPYKTIFQNSLPQNKQYWTMCSNHSDEQGNFQPHSELGQLLEESLITENQFYGVDIEPNIIQLNKLAKPNVNWINDDFLRAMQKAFKENNFNPGVVNADLISLKHRGSRKSRAGSF
jgi:hypothetical protein